MIHVSFSTGSEVKGYLRILRSVGVLFPHLSEELKTLSFRLENALNDSELLTKAKNKQES